MNRFWDRKKIAWITILAIAICGSMLTHVSSYAAERTVTVDNHTPYLDAAKEISGITISGLDKPIAGMSFDAKAAVITAEGYSWEIPVLWVRDDLQIDKDICDEGHNYSPVLCYVVCAGYAIDGDTYTITLRDDVTKLFGASEIISSYDASTGITYILPASLMNLFAGNNEGHNEGHNEEYNRTDPYIMPGQDQARNNGTVSVNMPGQNQKENQNPVNAINLLKDKAGVLEAKNLHVANVKAKARKGRKVLITWKKNKKADGYQIRYSTRKDFKKAAKNVTVNKASVCKKWLKKLQAGKTYYVKVRTVKKITSAVTGKKKSVYGRWSATKRFKVKFE